VTDDDQGQVDVPTNTLPLDSVGTGALIRRSPGNWVTKAILRPEITREDPHGEDFLPQLYIAMIEAFFAEINGFINSITNLLGLGGLLGDLGLGDLSGLLGAMTDAPDLPAGPASATARPNLCRSGARHLQDHPT